MRLEVADGIIKEEEEEGNAEEDVAGAVVPSRSCERSWAAWACSQK